MSAALRSGGKWSIPHTSMVLMARAAPRLGQPRRLSPHEQEKPPAWDHIFLFGIVLNEKLRVLAPLMLPYEARYLSGLGRRADI
jgi:hypothetical protein